MANFAGTCTSDNKGLLLLLLYIVYILNTTLFLNTERTQPCFIGDYI